MPIPRQLLTAINRVPTQMCIHHEVGHATIAYRQGGYGSIVFFSNLMPHYAAFATNNKLGASWRDLIIRSLVGVSTQARLYPQSVSDWLCDRLINGGLFASNHCLRSESRAEREMTANQAEDDWRDIKESAKRHSRTLLPRLQELRSAEAELREIFLSEWFLPVVQTMATDINCWLDQDGDYSPEYVNYSTNRIAAIFAQVPGAIHV